MNPEAVARLGRPDCIVCEADACYCALAQLLRSYPCGHSARGWCAWCLAEALMVARRGNTAGALREGRRLIAALRLGQIQRDRRRVQKKAARHSA